MPKHKKHDQRITCPICMAAELLKTNDKTVWPMVIEYYGELFSQLIVQSMKGALPEVQAHAIRDAFIGLGKKTLSESLRLIQHPDAGHTHEVIPAADKQH